MSVEPLGGLMALGMTEMAIIGFLILIFLIPMIFYLITLQNTLNLVSPENRRMAPSNVWLLLIPLFSLVWRFFVVNNIADSLKLEFMKRGIPVQEPRPGYGVGLAMAILYCCAIVPFLGILASIGGLICWIIYWVRINEYKNMLEGRR